jgi:hypothetical protein
VRNARSKCASAALPAAILLGSLQAGCSFENYGLDYTHVQLSATRPDALPASGLPTPVCITLPILMGSIVEERRRIEGSLGVSLRASAEQVELRFYGAATATDAQIVTIDELENGHRMELDLETREGSPVTVVLSSPCSGNTTRSL